MKIKDIMYVVPTLEKTIHNSNAYLNFISKIVWKFSRGLVHSLQDGVHFLHSDDQPPTLERMRPSSESQDYRARARLNARSARNYTSESSVSYTPEFVRLLL